MKNRIINIYNKYKEIINYILVGIITMIINLLIYHILSYLINININILFIITNIISWFITIVVAYILNKIYVFNNDKLGKECIKEFFKFLSSRIFTLLAELLFMFIFVKLLYIQNDLSKLIVQIIVVILNYIFSKIYVFKKETIS